MATIAAALIGAGSAYYASRQAKKRSQQERDAADRLGANSALAGQYGTDLLGKSRTALDPVYDYYSKLATGDRNALQQYLSPEILAQTQGARTAFQTGSELAPRSGMGTESVSRIPTQNSSALAQLFQSARPAGIQGLATLGTNWGSLGMQGLNSSSSGAGNVLGYEADRRNQQRQAGIDAGSSAYEIFKLIQGLQSGSQARAQNNQNINTANQAMSFWKL